MSAPADCDFAWDRGEGQIKLPSSELQQLAEQGGNFKFTREV